MSTKHKHDKKTNVVNRTTSETLRLSESELRLMPQSTSNATTRKKIQNSSSSFQITGVSMTRTDVGDDSADDLDTDDISRVTDNETPSFSEDSRDTDDHQLELVMHAVEQSQPSPSLHPPPPAETTIRSKTADERFKIVKMPRTTPFSRGRWICVDYFDEDSENDKTVRPPAHIFESAFSRPHPQNVAVLNPVEDGKDHAQAYSAILSSQVQMVNFGSRGTQSQKAIKQPSSAHGQKDDILSDIKIALTSMPTSHSGSAPNNYNIDRKIEEALDAVKTHLMVAVHKEVDFLKTRVSTLEGRVNELEIENSILRVNYLLFKS